MNNAQSLWEDTLSQWKIFILLSFGAILADSVTWNHFNIQKATVLPLRIALGKTQGSVTATGKEEPGKYNNISTDLPGSCYPVSSLSPEYDISNSFHARSFTLPNYTI